MGAGGGNLLVLKIKRADERSVSRRLWSFMAISTSLQSARKKKGRTLEKVGVLISAQIGQFLKIFQLMSFLHVELASLRRILVSHVHPHSQRNSIARV